MANAIPAGIGDDKPAKETAPKEDKKLKQKDVIEMPKAKEKITLPDGTIVENY